MLNFVANRFAQSTPDAQPRPNVVPTEVIDEIPPESDGMGTAGIIIGILLVLHLVFFVLACIHLLRNKDVPKRALWFVVSLLVPFGGLVYLLVPRRAYNKNKGGTGSENPLAQTSAHTPLPQQPQHTPATPNFARPQPAPQPQQPINLAQVPTATPVTPPTNPTPQQQPFSPSPAPQPFTPQAPQPQPTAPTPPQPFQSQPVAPAPQQPVQPQFQPQTPPQPYQQQPQPQPQVFTPDVAPPQQNNTPDNRF